MIRYDPAKSKEKRRKRNLKKWYNRRVSGQTLRTDGKTHPLKVEAMEAYGGKCKCGQDDVTQLQLDHVNDNGHQHRLYISKGRAGMDFYRALKKRKWPNKEPYLLEVVCFDCHVTTTADRRLS